MAKLKSKLRRVVNCGSSSPAAGVGASAHPRAVLISTARKAAEAKAIYLASFPEQNPNPVMEVDLQGSIRYINPAAAILFPKLLQQGLAHPWLRKWATIVRAIQASRTKSFTRVVVVDNCTYHQSLHYFPAEQFVRIYGFDITQQKQAEAALVESETRFRVLFDGANDGMLLADGQSKRFLLANRQIQKWLGYSAAKLVQMGVRDIHPAANRPRIIKDFERQNRQEISLVQNIPMQRKDGTIFYADVSSAQITLQGRPYQLGIFRDVTERKRLESEIQQISEIEKQRLGRDLHDGLSQQVTAVRYIASELESALREQGLPEAHTAAKIVRELSQASKQIHDIARGLCPIELKNWDIVSALEELAAATTERFQIASRVTGSRQIHWADRDTARQLYRIAQEAITNAGKHSHGQHIAIRLVKQPGRIILTVKDDGRGIPARKRRGTGLGLPIMQYRANLINADLTIDRAPGGGTLVTCVLPTLTPQRRQS